tara:strand:+ start:2120 stop:3292 length:1173 start_codon:yes stop_codon:yes gene_type:complete
MKKNVYLLGLILVFYNCSQRNEGDNNSNALNSNNLKELNEQKAFYTKKINDLNVELEKINNSIEDLTVTEKRILITALKTKATFFEHQIEVQANIKTRKNIMIYPEFNGRLIKLNVSEGQNVKKGKLLALIDDAGLKDQLEQSKLQLDLAKTTFERTERLWEQKIGSEMMYLEAKTRYKSAFKQVSQIKQQLSRTKVYAPFDGIIDEISARLGGNLVPGVTPILRIINLNSMYVESDVPENYLPNIIKGSKALVTIPALNQIQTTQIQQTGNYITPSNRTFRIEAPIKNSNGLIKPNLNARLSIVDYTNPKAILVPQRVIREDAKGEPYVFVLKKPEENQRYTTEKRKIIIGKNKKEMIEITKGLTTDELVVDEGVSLLVENQKVKRIIE